MSTGNLKIFSERFRKARKAAALSVEDVAKAVDVAGSTVYGWEAGKYFPRREKEQSVAALLNVSTPWLLGITDSLEPPVNAKARGPVDGAHARHVPGVTWARAGSMKLARAYEDLRAQIDSKIATKTDDPKAIAIQIEGDSMEHEFKHGDWVIISPSRAPVNGEAVVAQLRDGRIFLKRFWKSGPEGEDQLIVLESDNPLYKTLQFHRKEFESICPVVDQYRNPSRHHAPREPLQPPLSGGTPPDSSLA